jgi:hypothetical protein
MTVRSITFLTTVALLAGCGGSSPVPPPQSAAQTSALLSQTVKRDAQHYGNDIFIYTAQLYGNDVSVYKRSGFSLTLDETIYAGFLAPQGTVTTSNGWWYIANSGYSNVLVYKTTKQGPVAYPSETLTDYGQTPVNVDAGPSRKLVAVSNGGTSSKTGSVSVYVGGSTEPSRILTYGSDVLQGEGVAIDHQGNCYWSFNDSASKSGSIVEFTNCSGNGSVVLSGLTNAGGMVFDQSDNLYYVDQASGIYKCNKTPKGKPGCSVFVAVDNNILFHPTNINFDHKDKSLWISDAAGYIDAVTTKGTKGKYELQDFPAPNDPYGIAPAPGG